MNVVNTICLSGLVELSQNIPENGAPVCPGQVLQYTCSSNTSPLSWIVGSNAAGGFSSRVTVNSSIIIGEFLAVLTANDGSFLSSTLTNTMITLGYNGQQVQCAAGSSLRHINIAVAGNQARKVTFNVNKVASYTCILKCGKYTLYHLYLKNEF